MAQVSVDIIDVVDKMLAAIRTGTALGTHLVYTVPDENAGPAIKKNVQVVTMALTSFLPDVGQQTGGAAYQQTFNQTFRTIFVVNVWTVYMVDQVGQNDKWLRDSARGSLPLFMKVFKSLEQYNPRQPDDNNTSDPVMLEQPMRLSPGGFQFIPSEQTGLQRIRSEWEVSFIQKLPS